MSSLPQLYQPLDRARRQIRLLLLLPSEDTSIRCSLNIFDLDEEFEFKALSYEWGPAEHSQTILVNNQRIQVRKNLFDFLQVYKQRADPGYIWIDQICIDQDCLDEKGHQVAFMGDIYRNADETLVWLGPDPSEGRAFDVVRTLSSQDLVLDKRLEDYVSREECDAVWMLMEQSYWTRFWIAQEIALSSGVIMLFGSHELTLVALYKVLLDLKIIRGSMHAYDTACGALQIFIGDFDDIQNGSKYAERTFWESYCHLAEASACENPRDKIYGIQSLLPTEMQVEVNYTLRTYDVFVRAVLLWYPYLRLDDIQRLAYSMELSPLDTTVDAAAYDRDAYNKVLDVNDSNYRNEAEVVRIIQKFVWDKK